MAENPTNPPDGLPQPPTPVVRPAPEPTPQPIPSPISGVVRPLPPGAFQPPTQLPPPVSGVVHQLPPGSLAPPSPIPPTISGVVHPLPPGSLAPPVVPPGVPPITRVRPVIELPPGSLEPQPPLPIPEFRVVRPLPPGALEPEPGLPPPTSGRVRPVPPGSLEPTVYDQLVTNVGVPGGPGDVMPRIAPEIVPVLAEEIIDECIAVKEEIKRVFSEAVDACRAECLDSKGQCLVCVQAYADRYIDAGNALVLKCRNKIWQQLVGELEGVHAAAAQFGITWPTPDDVQSMLLGSYVPTVKRRPAKETSGEEQQWTGPLEPIPTVTAERPAATDSTSSQDQTCAPAPSPACPAGQQPTAPPAGTVMVKDPDGSVRYVPVASVPPPPSGVTPGKPYVIPGGVTVYPPAVPPQQLPVINVSPVIVVPPQPIPPATPLIPPEPPPQKEPPPTPTPHRWNVEGSIFCNPSAFQGPQDVPQYGGDTRIGVPVAPSQSEALAASPDASSSWIGWIADVGTDVWWATWTLDYSKVWDRFTSGLDASEKFIADAAKTIIGGLVAFAAPAIAGGPCQSVDFVKLATTVALPNFLNFFGKIVPDNYAVTNQYMLNYLCPYLIPSANDLNAMRSAGWITETQWLVGIKANGLCPEWGSLQVSSQQTVPNVLETQIAYRRELIDDDSYAELMKRNRVADPYYAEVFWRLTEYIPGPSDLIRYMVRDVEDKDVVKSQHLDDDFPEKYIGLVEFWSRAQGMDRDTFLREWRAHWQYPSNTQLYEMLHRLRPDRPERGDWTDAINVKLDDVRRVIKINDMVPVWVDPLIAISYLPLTRVDVRRMYEVGVLDYNGVYHAYRDLGYDVTNATRLADFTERLAKQKRAQQAGALPAKDVVSLYKDYALSYDDAFKLLLDTGVGRDPAAGILASADVARAAVIRRNIVNAVKKRFLSGEYDSGEAKAALINAGVVVDGTDEVIAGWAAVLSQKNRQPTLAQLCKMLQSGHFNVAEYRRRARNLGFSDQDALSLASMCVADYAKKKAAEIAAELKKASAAAEKRAKELRPCKPRPKPVCPFPG